MGHGDTRFSVDCRSSVWYVVDGRSPPETLALTHVVRNEVRHALLVFSPHPLLLTGIMMGVSQHLRLHPVCPRVADEGVKGMEFVSWPRPFFWTRSCRGVHSSYITCRMMLLVATLQFALATGHVISIVVQLVRGFGGTSNRTLYLLDQSTPEHLAQEYLYITNVRLTTSKFHLDTAH